MKVLASIRVRSSHGPDTDYELLHVDIDGRQSVVVRLVRGTDVFPAEIHVDDLAGFRSEWDRFVQDVQRRRGVPAGPIERKAPEVPYIPVRKVKKIGGLPNPATPPPPPDHDILAFQLSNPPSVESVMSAIDAQPRHLIVVTPLGLVAKVEEHLLSLKTGLVSEPEAFTPIEIRRTAKGPQARKRLFTDVVTGISRVLGERGSVLWILPES